MLVKQLVVGMMGVCCYVVSCEETGTAVVIDPGGDEEHILDYISEQGLSVKYIIATHGHLDHVCGNGPIQLATGGKIVMHEADVAYFSDRPFVAIFLDWVCPNLPRPISWCKTVMLSALVRRS